MGQGVADLDRLLGAEVGLEPQPCLVKEPVVAPAERDHAVAVIAAAEPLGHQVGRVDRAASADQTAQPSDLLALRR